METIPFPRFATTLERLDSVRYGPYRDRGRMSLSPGPPCRCHIAKEKKFMSEESLEAWEREYEAWEEKYYDDWLNIGNPWEEDGPCSICRGDQVSLRNRRNAL